MNLSDITQAFESGDFARPNLFEVEIPYLGKTFKLKCKAATMPASTVEKVPVGYMNRKLNIAGDRIYDDWTITVYNDDAHDTRKALLNWSNQAHGRGDAITGETPAQYKKTALVRQFHRNGQTVTHEETIQGLWPTNIGELQYDWDSNNEVSTFECTFAIDWVD